MKVNDLFEARSTSNGIVMKWEICSGDYFNADFICELLKVHTDYFTMPPIVSELFRPDTRDNAPADWWGESNLMTVEQAQAFVDALQSAMDAAVEAQPDTRAWVDAFNEGSDLNR